ncbi:MAG: hypothetical protein ACM3MG_04040 [Bacillota bacterium]
MLDVLQRLTSQRLTAQEALVPIGAGEQFWHCSLLNEDGFPVSGGFGQSREYARKVAVAEFLERMNYEQIKRTSEDPNDWGLDKISTACGFAVGFHRENTIIRSITEAHERWVMSKWIDEDYLIEEIAPNDLDGSLDKVSRYFASHFDKVLYFKKDLVVPIGGNWMTIEVGQTMGLKDGGIFPGSSAQKTGGNIWQHSLLESFRHLLAIKNNPLRGDLFPDNKVHFFAKNAQMALAQIYRPKKCNWPIPHIGFHRCDQIADGNYFLARTIVEGWTSWNLGPIDRFLY